MTAAVSRLRRLGRMSGAELAYRGRELGRRAADRIRVAARTPRWQRKSLHELLLPVSPPLSAARDCIAAGDWDGAHALLSQHFLERTPHFVVHPSSRERLVAAVRSNFPAAEADASERTARIAAGEYDILGYEGLRYAADGPPDWWLDAASGRRAPGGSWTTVPYLDPRSGDHKVIWELNRHQYWIALGRAEWLSGDGTARRRFQSELDAWLAANPPLVGVNWASALELALRSISWTWALELFVAPPAGGEPPWTIDLLLGLDRQLAQVERHLSRYFSPNTHLLGEALALYVCGRALPELRGSARRAQTGREVLLEESTRQVLPDGGHAERSLHYHRYALEFSLLALTVATITEDRPVAEALIPVTRRMAEFLHHFCDAAGRYPQLGDDDGGELCPIAGHNHGHARQTLGWAAELLAQPALQVGPRSEAVLWLTSSLASKAPAASDASREPADGEDPDGLRHSVVFRESGYLAARHGGSRATMDVGAHGYLNGGHAHADALAVTIAARGASLLVDPGTGTYTMDPGLRDRLRSSQWHNTLSLDGRSQSQTAGPFAWASMASSRLAYVVLNPRFDCVEAETDAWGAVTHQRIFLMAGDDYWVVADRIAGPGSHRAELHWHIDPLWQVDREESSGVRLVHCFNGETRLTVPDARIDVFRGDHASGLGWWAPVYGRVEPATTIRASVDGPAPFWIVTTIDAAVSSDEATTSRLEVLAVADAGDPVAVCTSRGGVADVTICRAEPSREMVSAAFGSHQQRAITTDARIAHVRVVEPGRIERLYLADVSAFRFDGAEPLTLAAAERIPDLAVELRPGREPVLESSAGGLEVSLSVGARGRREGERLQVRTRDGAPSARTRPPCAV